MNTWSATSTYVEQHTLEMAEPKALAGPFKLMGRTYLLVDIRIENAGSWTDGVCKLVYRLAPGCEFREFDAAVTFTAGAPYTTNPVDCTAVNEVYVQVSTVNGTAIKAIVTFSREA